MQVSPGRKRHAAPHRITRTHTLAPPSSAQALERWLLTSLPPSAGVTLTAAVAPLLSPGALPFLAPAVYGAAYALCLLPLEPSFPAFRDEGALPPGTAPQEVAKRAPPAPIAPFSTHPSLRSPQLPGLSVVRPTDAALQAWALLVLPPALVCALRSHLLWHAPLHLLAIAAASAGVGPLVVKAATTAANAARTAAVSATGSVPAGIAGLEAEEEVDASLRRRRGAALVGEENGFFWWASTSPLPARPSSHGWLHA